MSSNKNLVKCANEGEKCNATKNQTIYYGSDDVYLSKLSDGNPVVCNAQMFGGDQMSGTNACYIKSEPQCYDPSDLNTMNKLNYDPGNFDSYVCSDDQNVQQDNYGSQQNPQQNPQQNVQQNPSQDQPQNQQQNPSQDQQQKTSQNLLQDLLRYQLQNPPQN